MSQSDVARFFDRIAGRYERSYALSANDSRTRMDRVLRELPPPPSRVLDLGVGTGRELTALLDAGYAPTGVDISPRMLERCARRARSVPLLASDFWQPLPLDTGSFDAAVALHGSLAHSPDDGALARLASELARVVRPGGIWIAEIPSPAWLDRAEISYHGQNRSVRRTGVQTCIYEDHVAQACIQARILSDEQWRTALGRHFTLRIEALAEAEWLLVATRA